MLLLPGVLPCGCLVLEKGVAAPPLPAAPVDAAPASIDAMPIVVDESTVFGILDSSSVTSRSSDSNDQTESGSSTMEDGTNVFNRTLRLNPSPSGLLPLWVVN